MVQAFLLTYKILLKFHFCEPGIFALGKRDYIKGRTKVEAH